MEELNLYKCIQLLEICVKNGPLQTDPLRSHNVLVYFLEDEEHKEGWYSINLISLAEDLLDDKEGQETIMRELFERGIEYTLCDVPKFPPFRAEDF